MSGPLGEDAVDRLLRRAYEIAAGPLEGINDAALELVDLAGDDVTVLDRARKIVAERVMTNPDHASKQVQSFLRRAFELGHWRWEISETNEVP